VFGAYSSFAQEDPGAPPPQQQEEAAPVDPAGPPLEQAPPEYPNPAGQASTNQSVPNTGWRHFSDNRPPDPVPAPPVLVVPSGSWLTVRMSQPLSSDHNQAGDAFMATLAQPVVVNGIVVARRGQTVSGRVSVAEKAGRVKGTARLGVEITELGLVDGQQVTVHTQLVNRAGDTSVGRDAGAIGVTTGTGAAIGAAAAGGVGAGLGAAAGLGASIIGVLVTRGHPSVIYPEQVLTFRLDAPVRIATQNAPEAFQPVRQGDYGTAPTYRAARPAPSLVRPAYFGVYPYMYPYGPYYSPYYFGTGFYFGGRYHRRW
jgi:type IV secretion system protein VirB10